jgi:hypothetical protein
VSIDYEFILGSEPPIEPKKPEIVIPSWNWNIDLHGDIGEYADDDQI